MKIDKSLSKIECFQSCLSTKNSNSVSLSFETKLLRRMKKNVQEELANKTDNCTVSYKHRKDRILLQIK